MCNTCQNKCSVIGHRGLSVIFSNLRQHSLLCIVTSSAASSIRTLFWWEFLRSQWGRHKCIEGPCDVQWRSFGIHEECWKVLVGDWRRFLESSSDWTPPLYLAKLLAKVRAKSLGDQWWSDSDWEWRTPAELTCSSCQVQGKRNVYPP